MEQVRPCEMRGSWRRSFFSGAARCLSALSVWLSLVLFIACFPFLIGDVLTDILLLAAAVFSLLLPARILHPWAILNALYLPLLIAFLRLTCHPPTGFLHLLDAAETCGIATDIERVTDILLLDALISYYHLPLAALLTAWFAFSKRRKLTETKVDS